MIIQTDLAPRDHLGMLREFLELRVKLIVKQTCFVGMNADCRVDERIPFGDAKRGCVRVCSDFAVADANDDLDSGIERALDHGFAVGVEFASLDVSMRVDVHRGR